MLRNNSLFIIKYSIDILGILIYFTKKVFFFNCLRDTILICEDNTRYLHQINCNWTITDKNHIIKLNSSGGQPRMISQSIFSNSLEFIYFFFFVQSL